jgi:hypothetical protein
MDSNTAWLSLLAQEPVFWGILGLSVTVGACSFGSGDVLIWIGILDITGGIALAGYYEPDLVHLNPYPASTRTPLLLLLASCVTGGGFVAAGMHKNSSSVGHDHPIRAERDEEEELLRVTAEQKPYQDLRSEQDPANEVVSRDDCHPAAIRQELDWRLTDSSTSRRKNRKQKDDHIELIVRNKWEGEQDDVTEATEVTLELGSSSSQSVIRQLSI